MAVPACRWLLLALASAWAPTARGVKGDGGPPGTEDYYWPKRAGTYIGHGQMPFDIPVDLLRRAPAWQWDNVDDELFRHGPVIDGKKNIYMVTARGWIRKFSPDGDILWSWESNDRLGKIVTSPFLSNGRLFVSSMGPGSAGYNILVHCFDMETGVQVWTMPGPTTGHMNHDSSTVHIAEGILLGALVSIAKPETFEGNNMIFAMNATSGQNLWDFTMDAGVVWNFMPSTPGDGTFFFTSQCGVAQRRKLVDGSIIWKSPVVEPGHWCSTGGGTLGPNGVFYTETNYLANYNNPLSLNEPLPGVPPCMMHSCPYGIGLLAAYNGEDGKVLWARRTHPKMGGMQYPAVGRIGSRLVVAAGIGDNPAIAEALMGPRFLPLRVRLLIQQLQLKWSFLRRMLEIPIKRNGVAAYDAETGKILWVWEEEPWDFFACKGDEHTLVQRIGRFHGEPRKEVICGPDNWAIPAISADGTVVIASGSTGKVYAIKDADENGIIDKEEVLTYDAKIAFLNGPALAPGLIAVAPCWGPMYVFKS